MKPAILFLDDWKNHPNAVIHEQTRNESWLFHFDVFRAFGISNYFWHLALLDTDLIGVDPRDPGLDPLMMAKIKTECIRNPWYYFREVHRVPDGSETGASFRANRGNLAAMWSFYNHVDYMLVMIRQAGKSVVDDSLDLHVACIAGEGVVINKLTKDHKLRKSNVDRIKGMRDLLPSYLNIHDHRKDKDNQEEITFVANKNKINFFVGQASIENAQKVGRGHTAEINRDDEGPFTPNIGESLQSMLQSGSTKRDIAKARGSFYCTSYTTTAGKINTDSGKFMYRIKEDAMYFTENLYDCANEKHLHRRVVANAPGKGILVNITMGYLQLGHDDRWLKRKIVENRLEGEEIDRDLLNRWTAGNVSHPLPPELVNDISSSQMDPKYVQTTSEEYMIRWYKSKAEVARILGERKVVVGNDSSQAIGKDAMTLVFTDTWTAEVIGTACINETNVYMYIQMLGDLMIANPAMVLIPECKDQGRTLIDGVIHLLVSAGVNPISRIYNTIVDSDDWNETRYEWSAPVSSWTTEMHAKFKRCCGFITAGRGRHSRDALYTGTLKQAAELSAYSMNDERLIGEVLGLEKKDDRIDHPVLGHDDMVVAWMLTHWMLIHSKNLSAYGIERPYFKANSWVPDAKKDTSPKNAFLNERDMAIKEEILSLVKKLESISCPYTTSAIIRMAKSKHQSLSANGRAKEDIGSIDALISRAREVHDMK